MLILKAFHIIAMVCWFAGLFYLPRLFVYHAETQDQLSIDRFKIMERRLYYGITWPAAVLTTIFGLSLMTFNLPYYAHAGWMHIKLGLVFILWIYHFICGHFRRQFYNNYNERTPRFYRLFNEIPTVLLVSIVMFVVIKP